MSEPDFRAPGDFKRPKARAAAAGSSGFSPNIESSSPPHLLWEYQWEDSINAINERSVDPPLADRLVSELVRASLAGVKDYLIFVRGDLGIGKSTLVEILHKQLNAAADRHAQDKPLVATALRTCSVLEANDLESSVDFASRVNKDLREQRFVVALARPLLLQAAALWIQKSPEASVRMSLFEPTRPVFSACLNEISRVTNLPPVSQERLRALASRLPSDLQTPFYFREIANVIKEKPDIGQIGQITPLELFRRSLERRIGEKGAVDKLIDCAFGQLASDQINPIPGIIEPEGFLHDGYRTIILAEAVLKQQKTFEQLALAPNPVPAMGIVLHHIQSAKLTITDTIIVSLSKFVRDEPDLERIPYAIYFQGLVASMLRNLRFEEPAKILRERCLRLIAERKSGDLEQKRSADTIWWDISDALSLVGDPRMQEVRRAKFNKDSTYFTFVPPTEVEIGSDYIPERVDKAKPVLPFGRTTVTVGPLWVANFLVTTEQFREFWSQSNTESFFRFTGAQWVNNDVSLMNEIEASFSIAARRCFWKELIEKEAEVSALEGNPISILEIARRRALRKDRIALWDPTQADDRFIAPGNPVVGVTWWEAMAFCAWWTSSKLDNAGFPHGAVATLPTDWEWEAMRRLFYEDQKFLDGQRVATGRYPAHLRQPNKNIRSGRVSNPLRPLHVGLAPTPSGKGPFDMVGNVWEWTRSRVFGRIKASSVSDDTFGPTVWDDVDPKAEGDPVNPNRDIVDAENDLSYRAVRGGSFFSRDDQAAWHPAYRLCDPPFSSYFDLGFRLAVYGPK